MGKLTLSQAPLLAPDLDGYRLYLVAADEFSGTFGYLILPSSVSADADLRAMAGSLAVRDPGFFLDE
ncbi:hypothetical protein OHA37_03625 [Streptomyces sp. NBC_00335]|uniref:hypothetical protein n=1 Tax=unclassified Streptomyces TaxID=2593676 RepID=UPI002258F536|nr:MULTISPECIES: hypothetical protein [unclassified Streptomyces]MCX5402975.1 hypothetical protein [Streptomyces sp. NBC_00086]